VAAAYAVPGAAAADAPPHAFPLRLGNSLVRFISRGLRQLAQAGRWNGDTDSVDIVMEAVQALTAAGNQAFVGVVFDDNEETLQLPEALYRAILQPVLDSTKALIDRMMVSGLGVARIRMLLPGAGAHTRTHVICATQLALTVCLPNACNRAAPTRFSLARRCAAPCCRSLQARVRVPAARRSRCRCAWPSRAA
jgi:hypothetical protein